MSYCWTSHGDRCGKCKRKIPIGHYVIDGRHVECLKKLNKLIKKGTNEQKS